MAANPGLPEFGVARVQRWCTTRVPEHAQHQVRVECEVDRHLTVGLAQVEDELHTALGDLEQTLTEGDGPVRLDDEGDLVISPLSAEDIPAEADLTNP